MVNNSIGIHKGESTCFAAISKKPKLSCPKCFSNINYKIVLLNGKQHTDYFRCSSCDYKSSHLN